MALPGMLGHIVGDIVRAQPDMEVVAAVDDVRAAGEAAGRAEADFVLVGDVAEREWTSILCAHPGTRVVSVEGNGRRGFLLELRPHRRPLAEASPEGLSPEGLVHALRVAAREVV